MLKLQVILKALSEVCPSAYVAVTVKDEVVDDSYKLSNKEFISIIPPIGGG